MQARDAAEAADAESQGEVMRLRATIQELSESLQVPWYPLVLCVPPSLECVWGANVRTTLELHAALVLTTHPLPPPL